MVHTTVRPSVLGGRVEKKATVSTNDRDGTRNVSYDVTRYDADGNEVVRERPDINRHFATQQSADSVASDKRRQREIEEDEARGMNREISRVGDRERAQKRKQNKKIVVDTATAISGRVQAALTGDAEHIQAKKGVNRDGKEVPQVPKEASKYAEGYQARRRTERERAEAAGELDRWKL